MSCAEHIRLVYGVVIFTTLKFIGNSLHTELLSLALYGNIEVKWASWDLQWGIQP